MIARVVVGVLVAAMLKWLPLHRRYWSRWPDRQARLDAVAAEKRRDWALTQQVEGIVADAEAAYRKYSDSRFKAALADDYAVLHPMPQRPAPPAAPGEPWQLARKNDTLGRLVEPAEPEINLGGEPS